MAAEDKKISVLTEWIYGSIQDAANIVVAYAGANYRIALQTISQYVLGDREIGGAGTRDITTNTDNQILTHKRLDSPAFNDNAELNSNVTATQMNFLQNLDVNVKQKLNSLDGDISGIENNVYNLYSTVDALQADKIFSTGIGVAAGVTSITINASSISNDDIDPYSLSISVYEQKSTLLLKLLNLSDIDVIISDDILSSIVIADVFPEKSYRIVIRYRLAD